MCSIGWACPRHFALISGVPPSHVGVAWGPREAASRQDREAAHSHGRLWVWWWSVGGVVGLLDGGATAAAVGDLVAVGAGLFADLGEPGAPPTEKFATLIVK